ncbi:hypothetical protein OSB04_013912 [Centaurea solstitialis]|uniref:R13L1/DRL21-like LRR repeat region domain-containing protein n=1 Tax=Centaurea solstitialis TaxID=347529 RepID=A0AA38TYV5_9ASTR|nr:hypothetical protein OSB04_013912 [Centaurea solstitialis]
MDVVKFGYKMHDMVHELAQYVMRHDCSIITPGRELIIPDEVLHLSSSCSAFVLSDDDSEKLRDGLTPRTLSSRCEIMAVSIFDFLLFSSSFLWFPKVSKELQLGPKLICISFEDARRAKLSCKINLTSLVISWGATRILKGTSMKTYNIAPLSSESVESVLEGLEPNSNLKELEIHHYPGEKISPIWMINLKNLVSIKFQNSYECNHISALGRLPALKSVDINRMQKLKRLHDEDNTTSANGILFPSPEILHIASCMNFISLPSNLPKLKRLMITYCPALRSLPDGLQCLGELDYLEISGCEDLVRRCEKETGEDWPKISHVPNIHLS